MKGTSEYRLGGPNDPLVQEIAKQKGFSEIPFYRSNPKKEAKFDLNECMQRWMAYAPDRHVLGQLDHQFSNCRDLSSMPWLVFSRQTSCSKKRVAI